MKTIEKFILEKLILNKDTKLVNNIYTFNLQKTKLSINVPFKFYFPTINKTVTISKVENGYNSWGDEHWTFYEKTKNNDLLPIVILSNIGISNVFIKQLKDNKVKPLILNINGEKILERLPIELEDSNKIIIKNIEEKLILNKDTKIVRPIYWFNKKQGIELPFELTIPELNNKVITIAKIEHTKPLKKDLWKLYDENGSHICTLYDLVLRTLLFNKTNRKVAILRIFDEELKKQVRNPVSVVVHYKDNLDKILQESIQESQDEPLKYSNIILLNPEEDSVLILRRANYMKNFRGMYGFPGGRIDIKDKDSKEAAIRELKEETGIELTWNEVHKCKKYDTIKNEDGSISDYWITTLETTPEIKLSKEHAGYEWFNDKSKKPHKWMPDIFQIIQKIL